MKILYLFLNLIIILTLFGTLGKTNLSNAQQVFKSSPFCTKVGDPTRPSPCLSQTETTSLGSRPQAPDIDSVNLRQAIIDGFGITMNGFSPQQLQWAWEKFWDVSKTNFINLTKGTAIEAASGTISEQIGCRSVRVGSAFSEPTLFKIVLTHELSHVIYWCNNDSLSRRSEHHNVFSQEGGVTGYGASGCLGTPPHTEDYAEMIAYYLNKGVVEQTARCNNRGQIPFDGVKFPLHLNLARTILGEY